MAELGPIKLRALEYIRNAGGALDVEWFDDDHDPIGPQLRDDLMKLGMVQIIGGGLDAEDKIVLTATGEGALAVRSR